MISLKYLSRRRVRPIVASANAARDRKDWAAAAMYYRRALDIAPDRADLWVQYGHMLKEGGDRNAAGEAYRRALSIEADNADTHLQLGHLQKLQGDIAAAVASYGRALTLDRELNDAAIELHRLGRGSEVERILALSTPHASRAPKDTDRIADLDARVRSISSQMATLLEHASTTKALAFELARMKSAASEPQHAVDGRLRRIEARSDAIAAQISTLLDHASATKAVALSVTRLKASVEAEFEERAKLDTDAIAATAAAIESQNAALADLDRRAAQQVASLATAHGRHVEDLAAIHAQLDQIADSVSDRSETQRLQDAFDHLQREAAESGASLHSLRQAFDDYAENRDQTIGYLLGRVEFVRRELLYEYQYAGRGQGFASSLAAEPHILDPDKLAQAVRDDRVVLNVGCGHIPEADCLNVDRRALPGVDIVAEADALPFEAGAVSEIRSSHLIEHFPEEALIRTVLPHWRDLLKPGGRLKAIAPDGQTMVAEYAGGRYPFDQFRAVLYGEQDYEGDYHFNLLTPESLEKILLNAGFSNIKLIEQGRRNGQCYEFEMEAFKDSP